MLRILATASVTVAKEKSNLAKVRVTNKYGTLSERVFSVDWKCTKRATLSSTYVKRRKLFFF